MKKVLSFDVDGVIADGSYIIEGQRTKEKYMSKTLLQPEVAKCLNWLAMQFDVWVLSLRKPEYGLILTLDWMKKNAINVEGLRGVICGLKVAQKADIAMDLNTSAHFDDDIRVLDFMEGGVDYLLDNPDYLQNQVANHPRRLYEWSGIMKVCTKLLKENK